MKTTVLISLASATLLAFAQSRGPVACAAAAGGVAWRGERA